MNLRATVMITNGDGPRCRGALRNVIASAVYQYIRMYEGVAHLCSADADDDHSVWKARARRPHHHHHDDQRCDKVFEWLISTADTSMRVRQVCALTEKAEPGMRTFSLLQFHSCKDFK